MCPEFIGTRLAHTRWWVWGKPVRSHTLTSEEEAGKEVGHAVSIHSRRRKVPFRANVIFLVLITRWTRQFITRMQQRQTQSTSLQAGTVACFLQESWHISQKRHNWNAELSAPVWKALTHKHHLRDCGQNSYRISSRKRRAVRVAVMHGTMSPCWAQRVGRNWVTKR